MVAQVLSFSTTRSAFIWTPPTALTANTSYSFSIYALLISGNGTFYDGYYGGISAITPGNNESQAFTATTSWQRYGPFTFTTGSADTVNQILFQNVPTDAATTTAGQIAFWGAQLEPGTVETTFVGCQGASPPPPPPPPPSAGTAPTQASAAGFSTNVFFDDFTSNTIGFGSGSATTWTANTPFSNTYPATTQMAIANSVLTMGTSTNTAQLNIASAAFQGAQAFAWNTGYFEARILASNWTYFYLRSLFNAENSTASGGDVLTNVPSTWSAEIDVMNSDQGKKTQEAIVVHTNVGGNTTSNNGPADTTSPTNSLITASSTLIGNYHIYGVLWTSTTITWYIDNVQVGSIAATASTNQAMYMTLGVQPGGVNTGTTSKVTPVQAQIDWVKVWQ